MKTNVFKKIMVVLLALVITIPFMNCLEAKADEKPYLSSDESEGYETEEMTIGIGSYGTYHSDFSYSKKDKYKIVVVNSKKKATYTFTSSDKKVVTVKKDKNIGYLTGVKAGKATITVKQKLNGKTTTIGKCKVIVEKATVDVGFSASIGKGSTYLCMMSYINPEAKYTYECKDKNFSAKDVRVEDTENEGFYYIRQECNIKKAGLYTVTVKETYNKKTRTLGKVEIYVPEVIEEAEQSVSKGEELGLWINYQGDYTYEVIAGKDLVKVSEDEYGGTYVKALKLGEVKVKFWSYDKKTKKKGKALGTFIITITEASEEE